MKVPNIFQKIDKLSRGELLRYGSYIIIPTDTPYNLYISYTFRLNNYRICYIIYNNYLCVLAKKINDNEIYTGYISSLQILQNENLGGLKGLQHTTPHINLIHKWKSSSSLDILEKSVEQAIKELSTSSSSSQKSVKDEVKEPEPVNKKNSSKNKAK